MRRAVAALVNGAPGAPNLVCARAYAVGHRLAQILHCGWPTGIGGCRRAHRRHRCTAADGYICRKRREEWRVGVYHRDHLRSRARVAAVVRGCPAARQGIAAWTTTQSGRLAVVRDGHMSIAVVRGRGRADRRNGVALHRHVGRYAGEVRLLGVYNRDRLRRRGGVAAAVRSPPRARKGVGVSAGTRRGRLAQILNRYRPAVVRSRRRAYGRYAVTLHRHVGRHKRKR
ncbi:MAG: hypothetical protein NZM43_13730, partial [Saprospiraceae bacterium]|nr:hypothetical protein [Saprospiraceae bacterium]MDW8485375.1 hypothetical protein [Saprospiraceae bacterium]